MEREDFRDWNGRGKERGRGVEGRKRALQNLFCFSSSSSSSFPFSGGETSCAPTTFTEKEAFSMYNLYALHPSRQPCIYS